MTKAFERGIKMDQKELIYDLERNEVLTKEIKSILLELDTTNSRATQAYLNDLLLIIRERLLKNEHMVDETTSKALDLKTYEAWIRNEFTTYSSTMYFDSIRP